MNVRLLWAWARRHAARTAILGIGCLLLASGALASGTHNGVLVRLNPAQVASFDAAHNTTAVRLNAHRNVYLVTSNDGETDQALLQEIKTDPRASGATLNVVIRMNQSTASVLNQSTASVLNQSTASVLNQSTASVLNQSTASVLNQSTASVLNQSTASVLNSETMVLDQSTASVLNSSHDYFGTRAPDAYINQPAVSQVAAGEPAFQYATGKGAIVALIDNGVAPFNPVLEKSLLYNEGWNFYDNSPNWSAWSDLAQSTASVLNGQSTASVLNQSTASVLNQSTASVLNQSTASVLNLLLRFWLHQSTASVLNGCPVVNNNAASEGQSTASVLNDETTILDQSTASVLNFQSTASVLNGNQALKNLLLKIFAKILQCDPDFGHGTVVAGLIHLIAPQAKILPIKAVGPGGFALASTLYQSITYAIDHHANVINMSLSSTGLDPMVQEAVQEAISKGIVIAAAAGNNATDAPAFPATLPHVLGVGAVDGCGATVVNGPCAVDPPLVLAGFSNFSGDGNHDARVGAPGVELYSTFPGFGLVWATSTGTSFSTPLVAGEAALLVQLGQRGNHNTFYIKSTADPAIPGDLHGELGHGLIQVLGAVKSAPPSSHHHH